MTAGEMILATMRGESPALPTRPRALRIEAEGLNTYSVTRGHDGCTDENVNAFVSAYHALLARYQAAIEALPAGLDWAKDRARVVAWTGRMSALEDQIQSAEDRDNYALASKLRGELQALRAAGPVRS